MTTYKENYKENSYNGMNVDYIESLLPDQPNSIYKEPTQLELNQPNYGMNVTYLESPNQPTSICKEPTTIGANQSNYISMNQLLAGKANPKTFIQPVIVPPPADLDYWKANNNMVYTAINEETNTDLYASGYAISECCVKPPCDKYYDNYHIQENFNNSPTPVVVNPIIPSLQTQGELFGRNKRSNDHQLIEPYEYPNKNEIIVLPNETGWVNTSCGYNPEQVFTSNLPSNLEVGNCQQSEYLAQYNKNIFTQNIGPDVYSVNQIVEPINSNMGISYQQQFPPTTRSMDKDGLKYTEHDPRIIEEPMYEPNTIVESVNESNVYDPRFTGYGTSYRSYNDNLLGQTKFMYDDIDAIRMPNYISRSNIDFEPFADSYGTLPKGDQMGNKNNSSIRELANNAWVRNSLEFRTGLQERLMRKRNSEMWETRVAPKAPYNYSTGGMSCK